MTRKKHIITDHRKFFDLFRRESDRACAILARALLENQLGLLFQSSLITNIAAKDISNIFDGQGPLATFSSRILLSYNMGMISKNEAADLNLIRSIGNEFAHGLDHEMTFNQQSISDRIGNLRLPTFLIKYNHLGSNPLSESEIKDIKNSHRRRFEIGVGILFHLLSQRISQAKHAAESDSLLPQTE